MKNKKAFTLIEFIIIILIIGIMSGVGTSILLFVIQNFGYTSNVMSMDMLASDALNKMIEGDNLAGGLRFSKEITAAGDNTLAYIDQSGNAIVLALNTGTGKLSRTINAAPDSVFLYYQAAPNTLITFGRNAKLFTYYDSSGSVTAVPADVRRVEVNLLARTASGSFADWQGSTEYSSSVQVSKYQ